MDKTFLNHLKIRYTKDGSPSLYSPGLDEHYHSKHGAIRESKHVFIDRGLDFFHQSFPAKEPLKILELGFGTGLNALLSLQFSFENQVDIHYHSVDAFPLPQHLVANLGYCQELDSSEKLSAYFKKMHRSPWGKTISISPNFKLYKEEEYFENLSLPGQFDLIFYDAFGSRVQPELWTEKLIAGVGKFLDINGVILTYAAKGNFKRACKSIGLTIEKLPGPPGKREMMRARSF